MDQDVLFEFINDPVRTPSPETDEHASVCSSDIPDWDILRDEHTVALEKPESAVYLPKELRMQS